MLMESFVAVDGDDSRRVMLQPGVLTSRSTAPRGSSAPDPAAARQDHIMGLTPSPNAHMQELATDVGGKARSTRRHPAERRR